MDGGSDSHSTIWSRLSRFFGHDDEESLEKAIQEARAEGEVEPDEESMLLGILRFNNLQVQDTMIPRTDIDCVPDDMPLPEVARVIVESGHSRIPVYRDTRDNMVGILHAKDLLRCLIDPAVAAPTAPQVMREPFFVPETKSIRTLLQEFRARKQHIAIALDEYGGTSGLITIEDVLEEIVGDIEDEHDTPRQEDIRPIGDRVYELTGRALLEDLEELGVALSSDEVDTIGGYLSMEAGHVPAPDESFTLDGWTFTVLEADKKLIRRLRMEPAGRAGAAEQTFSGARGGGDATGA
ncbi:hemolysin family protein [Desulfovibrio sp. ZJ369]|uniref:hemolysin family protein n=1 Tax=Desulfovibrio sp. ZJ369 TaxID=2709793 RepID=UPI0013EAA853|nr:hemolysin family protein [Desulfovibrio sp. ZJ369]